MDAYVIFGMGPAGLFLARQLKRQDNFAIIAIGKKDDVGRFSNTIDKYYVTEDVSGIQIAVEETKRNYASIVPFICSDQYLSLLFEQWPDAFDLLNFAYPRFEILELFSDKNRLLNYCRGLGMRMPVSESLSSVVFDGSPLVIKPVIKRGVPKLGKITVIRDNQSLERYRKRVLHFKEKITDYLVQPYIEGNNKFEYGYGGYFENGQPRVDVCFYQLRQYPQGVSCFALEIDDPQKVTQIIDAVEPFIKETNYSGFIQFDIKEDASTGLMYILDINPRPWGSVGMLSAHLDPKGGLWRRAERKSYCQWRFPLKEAFSLKNRMNVSYSEIHHLKSGKRYVKVIDLFDKKDIKPFVMQPIIMIMKLFKR